GQKLGLPKTDLNYQVLVEQISYLSNVRVKDKASLGINFLIPFVSKMDMDDGLNNAAIKAQSGFGDIMIGPFIQFDPVIGAQGPKFVHRFEFQVNLPTGEYNQQKDINPSNNAVSFDPYWAATYW
ncbi:transporter, partial [Klebsiella pneumoniae]